MCVVWSKVVEDAVGSVIFKDVVEDHVFGNYDANRRSIVVRLWAWPRTALLSASQECRLGPTSYIRSVGRCAAATLVADRNPVPASGGSHPIPTCAGRCGSGLIGLKLRR